MSPSRSTLYTTPQRHCKSSPVASATPLELIVRGDKLRIVNTSIAIGARALSARAEACSNIPLLLLSLTYEAEQIWNVTKHRLVASGVHIKMQPSPAKL